METSMKSNKQLTTGLTYAVLILGSIIMIFPFVWMLLTCFKTQAESMAIPPQILPSHWGLEKFCHRAAKPALRKPVYQYGAADRAARDLRGRIQLHGRVCLCQAEFPLQKSAVQHRAGADDAAQPDLHHPPVPDAGAHGADQHHLRAGVSRHRVGLWHLLPAADLPGHPQ